jgi:hypothetical protein
MTNVIPFPIRHRIDRIADPPAIPTPKIDEASAMDKIIAVVWGITAFCWTFMRFIIPVVVFWQFVRMLWFWDAPGVHAGWNFLAYFAGYTALYYFVAFYRPKAFRDRDANRGGQNARK